MDNIKHALVLAQEALVETREQLGIFDQAEALADRLADLRGVTRCPRSMARRAHERAAQVVRVHLQDLCVVLFEQAQLGPVVSLESDAVRLFAGLVVDAAETAGAA